ncbi:hypothetical protein [Natronoglomus mannanivorans]|uniref:Uncharacterized protein n=1 Tax=Natronoglomus mannanivorans TaxID=2979990 RepID=A0AAP3E395_9EURY|nr:hypothetical protein [Halobacteria archaeon AArc-xg1-1]
MSGYDAIRLETPTGTVVAYLAPSFEVVPQDQNDVFEGSRPDDSAIVTNNGLWTSELTVQGAFVHSDEARGPFQQALQDLHGQQIVTPDDQINRLREHTVYAPGQSYLHFYHRDNEYVAASDSSVDVGDGIYPVVTPVELRMPENGETSTLRTDFLIRLAIGTPRGAQEPTEPEV